MTRMTGPDCAVMCNLINTHTHTQQQVSLIPPWEDQCEWHRMTSMTGPDCAVMCNLINTHTHTHTHTHTRLHAISCIKTGWSSVTHNRVLHQALVRSLNGSKVQFVVEDTWPSRQRASEENGRLNSLRMDITTAPIWGMQHAM